MNLQIVLIVTIIALAEISAFSLRGLRCKEYPVPNTGSFGQPCTIRVWSITDDESESNYLPQIENEVQAVYQPFYGRESAWSAPAVPPSPNWRSFNNAAGTLYMREPTTTPWLHMLRGIRSIPPIPSNTPMNNIYNPPEAHNALELKKPFAEHELKTLVEDVSEVKNSMKDLTTYLKTILDKLNVPETNEPQTIKLNLQLDPSLEAVMEKFLQLMEQSGATNTQENNEHEASTESTEEDIESSTDFAVSSEETTTENENNSDESTTVQQEEISNEEISNEYEHTIDDLDAWLKLHFGPNVNKRVSDEEIEEIFNQTNEEEDAAESPEESFETWFNTYYYNKQTETPTTTTENSSEEKIVDTNEDLGEVNTTNESNENSQASQESNLAIEADDTSKSSAENKVSNEDETNYDTVFVPTTNDHSEPDTSVEEYLENADRYRYLDINAGNIDELTWNTCLRLKVSVKNFDSKELRRLINECIKQAASADKSSETNEKTDANSNESKDSHETETPATPDLEASEESSETEVAVTDYTETSESSETEATADADVNEDNDDNESGPADYYDNWRARETLHF